MEIITVSSLRNNPDNQINPRIDWIISNNIYAIYRYLKHKDTLQESLAIQNLKPPCFSSPPQTYQTSKINLSGNPQEVLTYLQDNQHCLSQLWNFDEIGFDLNGIWFKIVYNYNY